MIEVKEITTKKGIKQFVKFPFQLYKNNPYWVPPIIKDEVDSFDTTKNPVFDHADAQFFVAKKNGQIVGRVAAIINRYETEEQQLKKMRFGWFDVVDDIEVTKVLMNKVIEIGKQNHLDYIEGPVGFSNLDKTGILTEGFHELGTMITWYNHSYYKDHLEQLGFQKEKGYTESRFSFQHVDPLFFEKASSIIKKRFKVKPKSFSATKEIMPYVDEMFDLFSKSYSKLSSFVPISDKQITFFKEKYISFINPEYIKFVFDEKEKMIAFGIVMPSFSKALQKANGKLFPFGFYHLLQAQKKSKDVIFYLIGVAPEYQNKGITAILFEEYYTVFKDRGIENCIRTPELEDNVAIQQIWKHFKPEVYKRRSTYRLDL